MLICTSYNGLTQRVHDELILLNHKISIQYAINDEILQKEVNIYKPDLILAPFLKHFIPKSIYTKYLCIIIHPGIIGDRGASSLDWAIMNSEITWGVTAIRASSHVDAGDIYATSSFSLPSKSKSSIYRYEITKAAIICIKEILLNLKNPNFKALRLNYNDKNVKGIYREIMSQKNRQINWQIDNSDEIIRKINASDSSPGVLDTLFEEEYFLYGAHKDDFLKSSKIKQILAKRNNAICISTCDGSIWISHLRKNEKNAFKLPSCILLKDKLKGIKENRISLLEPVDTVTFKEITYNIKNDVAYLNFDFYNGAMGIQQCIRLKYAYESLIKEDIKVIVLCGGEDFFSNGLDLNAMQDSQKQGEDGWSNIHSINDIIKSIINTDEIITIASLKANAGAGGCFIALACDYVLIRQGVILNAHYKTLGLFGSEYHTYLLAKKVGNNKSKELLDSCLAIGAIRALEINLVNKVFNEDKTIYQNEIIDFCENIALSDDYYDLLDKKEHSRLKDEKTKPLEEYRKEELVLMKESFFNTNSTFNKLRKEFVLKMKPKETPLYLKNLF